MAGLHVESSADSKVHFNHVLLLLASMIPLALTIGIELLLVGRAIDRGALVPLLVAFLAAVLVTSWFVLPRSGGQTQIDSTATERNPHV
jgi:hypothetical protein